MTVFFLDNDIGADIRIAFSREYTLHTAAVRRGSGLGAVSIGTAVSTNYGLE